VKTFTTEVDVITYCIANGIYRTVENGALRFYRNGRTFLIDDYAKSEGLRITIPAKNGGTQFIYPSFKEFLNESPWPVIEETVDFSKPKGLIPNTNLYNVAPQRIPGRQTGADTSIIYKHIENLAGNVDDYAKKWLVDWFAQMIQSPHKKPGTAVTFRSEEGTGKGLLCDIFLGKIFNEGHLTTSRALFGERFNGDARAKIVINLNEGSWDKSRSDLGSIKQFITDPTFPFENKGKDRVNLPNAARLIMTTNSPDVVKADGTRRFAMYHPNKEDYASQEYFNKLATAIEDDDVVAQFVWECENRVIESNLRVIPITEELEDQTVINRDWYDSWFEEVIDDESASIEEIPLWENFSDNLKTCQASHAVLSLNTMMKLNLTSSKLSRRMKDIAKKFGYLFKKNRIAINGTMVVVWEFCRVIKNNSKTEITEITDSTSLDFEQASRAKTRSISCNSCSEFLYLKSAGAAKVICASTDPKCEWETTNKMLPGATSHKDCNVAEHSRFCFEIDDESREAQLTRAIDLFNDGVVQRVTDSGGKSYHCIVELSNPPVDKPTYKFVWHLLNNTFFEGKADTQCSNPARLTRSPGKTRSNGNEQTLVKSSKNFLFFEGWEEFYEAKLKEDAQNKFLADYVEATQRKYDSSPVDVDVLATRNICQEAKDLINNDLKDGERHSKIWAALASLKACNVSKSEALRLTKRTGIKDAEGVVNYAYKENL
jgi:hypothetical protein